MFVNFLYLRTNLNAKIIKTIKLRNTGHNSLVMSVVFDIDNLFDKYRFHITYNWQEQT